MQKWKGWDELKLNGNLNEVRLNVMTAIWEVATLNFEPLNNDLQ